ncbi:MAG: TonB-dependent receptor [Bacteroidia bacterium]
MFCLSARSQNDTTVQQKLKEVEVSSTVNTYSNETALNITNLNAQKIHENGSYNVSDALSKVPGINQINTGVAISKPVIRGLYGNRTQTVFSGLRFDNQQFQDEHGLGISDIGIDRIEVIKGPASLLYGSEAVGGVINIIEEKMPDSGKVVGDFNTRFYSNTTGTSSDLGFKGNKNNHNWRIRLGYESNADYDNGSDTSSRRTLNSRFDGYYLKASYGFHKKNWTCQNNFNNSLNDFGFIMADNYAIKKFDARQSRTMDGPHHTVLLNILSSENIFRLEKSILKLNFGGQSNVRMEDEGGGEISLNMHLSSLVYNLQWIKLFGKKTEMIISNQGLLQNNTNYGKRTIVPDANITENGLSLFINQKFSEAFILEGGAGGNYRHITTFETGIVNTRYAASPDPSMAPFSKDFSALNGMLGATINPGEHLNIKLCGSTGFRAGNLAELSSNGIHEGIYQFEIGDPNLKPEQNFNGELSFGISYNKFKLSAAAFENYFNNYIYLDPTSEALYGIPVFRFRQKNATLYGGEAALELHPNDKLEMRCAYSTVTGILFDGSYLPFIPADKISSEIRYTCKNKMYFIIGNDYVMAQSHPANYETSTNPYCLFNAGLGFTLNDSTKKLDGLRFSVMCNNLTDVQYYDHLSRFKAYGLYNIGRNIIVNLQIPFGLN